MHFFTQRVKVGPAFGMQKAHLVFRARHHNAVAVHQAGQRLHIKVGACISARYYFYSNLGSIGEHYRPI